MDDRAGRTGASRREFLRGAAAAAALAGAGGCALFRVTVDPDLVVSAEGGEFRVPADRLRGGDGGRAFLAVEVRGRDGKILLFRDAGGTARALDMTCTHRGCDVAWEPPRGRVVCPCHGSEFDPGGAVLHGPAPLPLRSHGVREDGGDLVVILGS